MSAELIPFGKYKGQPAEMLLADEGYRDWLLAQPWFREKFANVYNLVINYGSQPQDSPEHNEFQAKFLNHNVCLAVARALGFKTPDELLVELEAGAYGRYKSWTEVKSTGPQVSNLCFEVDGWDVYFRANCKAEITWGSGRPECTCHPCDHSECVKSPGLNCPCAPCDHSGGCLAVESDKPYSGRCNHNYHDRKNGGLINQFLNSQYHCDRDCFWHNQDNWNWLKPQYEFRDEEPYHVVSCDYRVCVELKPDLGDDYPSVLRQITNYPSYQQYVCLVVRRAEFRSVSLSDVRKIYMSRGVSLFTLDELVSFSDKVCRCAECMEDEGAR